MTVTEAPRRSPPVPCWVTGLDVLACALLALAAWTFLTGGPVLWIGEHKIGATSGVRVALWAMLTLAVRHAVFRRPRLDTRLVALARWVARPDSFDALASKRARPRSRLETAAVTALFALLTLIVTYPQVLRLDGVADTGDPLFSIWRLAWFAHQLPRDPLHLFDTNMFWPVRDTLALSDSMVVPGLVGAPFIWLGLAPAAVHSVMLLASFVLAGLGMYLLVRAITGQPTAAIVGAVAFAFCSFRLAQYSHFEQLFSFWMPLALLGLHRTFARGRLRDGLLTGAAVAGQYLSGLYMGAFFLVWIAPVGAILAVEAERPRAALKPLAAGALLAALLIAPVALPHMQVRAIVGERRVEEVRAFSARPADYLCARPDNFVYGDTWFGQRPQRPERQLFPGLLVLALAAVALAPPLSLSRLAYAAGLVVAFDASLGSNGVVFPFLYSALVPFRAFRAPARFSMLVSLSLALLASYGAARLGARIPRPAWRRGFTAALVAALALEAFLVRSFPAAPARPPAIYGWFDGRPRGVLAQLPTARRDKDAADPEAAYLYFSIFHWLPTLNGYSGAFPASYDSFRDAMERFPDRGSVHVLRKLGADYVVLQEERYGPGPYRAIVEALDQQPRDDLQELARMRSAGYEARVYRVVK